MTEYHTNLFFLSYEIFERSGLAFFTSFELLLERERERERGRGVESQSQKQNTRGFAPVERYRFIIYRTVLLIQMDTRGR
jgi:hypothetical protein